MKNKVTANKSSQWKNRIIGEGVEHPEHLLANPKNWRIHPKSQQDALTGMLSEVGWVQRVIVNKRTGFVVDGHMRVEVAISAGETEVPVLYVDLSEEEEAKVLATFDPISGMAAMDEEKFRELLSEVEFASKEARAAVEHAGADAGVFSANETQPPELASGDRAPFRQMTFTVHDEQFEEVEAAIKKAKSEGGSESAVNENSNGNALAWICGRFNRG